MSLFLCCFPSSSKPDPGSQVGAHPERHSPRGQTAPARATTQTNVGTSGAQTTSTTATQSVRLVQVYSPPGDKVESEIDIIAIHGLDTTSEETWVMGKHPESQVHWLKDSHMLPGRFPKSRIFYCDWLAETTERDLHVPQYVGQVADQVISAIQERPLAKDRNGKRIQVPIFFIASCVGGLVLMDALVRASHKKDPLAQATRGFIFLATPTNGTSFENVSTWLQYILKGITTLRGRQVTKMVELMKSGWILDDLVQSFTSFCREWKLDDNISIFYELENSNVLRKVPVANHLPSKKEPVVNSSSARLPIVRNNFPLKRSHGRMNRFQGDDKDEDYKLVVGQIARIFDNILQGLPIQQADAYIRKNRYSARKLEIERLSGTSLSMDSCYINLAIVEKLGENPDQAVPLPLSFLARQKVEALDNQVDIDLKSLFNDRKGPDGQEKPVRRILIRGRAGMGKTTLCKKILHDFYRGALKEWTRRFDRILWVPLRNLSQLGRRYDFEQLFNDEYFSLPDRRPELAQALYAELAAKRERTLFLLDGLDELFQALGAKSDFLEQLFDQPSVIFTSRPSAQAPIKLDLELETIGFYPNQVAAYIDADSELGSKAASVKGFIRKHSLINSLVRIPILLDALCYAWVDFMNSRPPQSMTQMYKTIEKKLWRKDAPRLHKGDLSQNLLDFEIEGIVEDERELLGWLAFVGLQRNVVEFTPSHHELIGEQFQKIRHPRREGYPPRQSDLALRDILASLSFLRASERQRASESQPNNQGLSYHFLHLTFQEYFAAQYFVRQWKKNSPLICLNLETEEVEKTLPNEFLRTNKYHSSFDIVWRFVAGLLEKNSKDAEQFFSALEENPLDLLGLSHQRVIMNCLSEVQSKSFSFRRKLEDNLSKWLVFQCKLLQPRYKAGSGHNMKQVFTLASEIEFPERALINLLQEKSHSEGLQTVLFASIKRRVQIPPEITERAISLLKASKSRNLTISIISLLSRIQDLPETGLNAIFLQLESGDDGISSIAGEALQSEVLPDSFMNNKLKEVMRGMHSGKHPKTRTCKVLGNRPIPETILNELVELLGSRKMDIRHSAADIFRYHNFKLPESVIEKLWSKFNSTEDHHIRKWFLEALIGPSELPPNRVSYLLDICARSNETSATAIKVLYSLSEPPDEPLSQILAKISREGNLRAAAFYEPREDESSAWCKGQLSNETLQNLVVSLNSGIVHVRRTVMRQISQRSSLEEPLFRAITERLGNDLDDWMFKDSKYAVILYRLMGSSDYIGIVNTVLLWLGKSQHTEQMMVSALTALRHCPSLPEDSLDSIAAYVNNPRLDIKRAAMNVLRAHSNLTRRTFNNIKKYIQDSDPVLAGAAMTAAIKYSSSDPRSTLSQTLLDISTRMNREQVKDSKIRKAAVEALSQLSDLPEDTMNLLVARLSDPGESHDVKMQVARCIFNQRSLSPRILSKIVQAYTPETEGIAAFEFLADTLVKRKGFHSQVLLAGFQGGFLSPLLLRSFSKSFSWYIMDGISYLEDGNGPEDERVPDALFIKKIEEKLDSARRAIGSPPVAALSSAH